MLADQLHVLYTFQLLRWWYGERIKVHKGLNIIKPSVKVSFLYGGPATVRASPQCATTASGPRMLRATAASYNNTENGRHRRANT